MTNVVRPRCLVLVTTTAATLLLFTLIAAGAQAAGLSGETFTGNFVPSPTCDGATDTGTLAFRSTGTAAGPFPGTYTETGSATISAFALTGFSASFTVTDASGAVTVTGSKTLPAPSTVDFASCLGATDMNATDLTYTATTPDCRPDQGTSTVTASGPSDNQGTFAETFASTSCTSPAPPSKCQARDQKKDVQQADKGKPDRDQKKCEDPVGA